jgi:hypothetical protein
VCYDASAPTHSPGPRSASRAGAGTTDTRGPTSLSRCVGVDRERSPSPKIVSASAAGALMTCRISLSTTDNAQSNHARANAHTK